MVDETKHRLPQLAESLRHAGEAMIQARLRLETVKSSGPSEASLRDATQAYEMAKSEYKKHKEAHDA